MLYSNHIRMGIVSLLAVAACLAPDRARAVVQPTPEFDRYQVILDRKPFGEIAPTDAAAAGALPPAEPIANVLEMKAILDDGTGLKVGFLDKKTTKSVYLGVGEKHEGIELVSADYDTEEATLKRAPETLVMKLHPDSNKDKAAPAAAAPLVAGLGGLQGASPSTARRPFFSDLKNKRPGFNPFQRMGGTNTPFQGKPLDSFFKVNTNAAMPFASPFRPMIPNNAPGEAPASPFQPVPNPNPNAPAFNPFTPPATAPLQPTSGEQPVTPFQPVAPATEPVETEE